MPSARRIGPQESLDLARLALAWRWLDEKDGLARNEAGDPWPLLDRAEKWSSRAESILAELEAEQQNGDAETGVERLAAAGRRIRSGREQA